jgi:hypothetical protein
VKLDIGCGSAKHPGFTGVDYIGTPDVLCDVAVERLPFDDRSVAEIFSAHCLEHIAHGSLEHVFAEMTRVAEDGARIEIWHPYAFHKDATVLGHVNYLTESVYEHLGCLYRDFWRERFGAAWILEEVRYVVEAGVLRDLRNARVDLEFAVRYLHDVVKEIGIIVRIDRQSRTAPLPFKRRACSDRTHSFADLTDGPVDTRDPGPPPAETPAISAPAPRSGLRRFF